MQPTCDQGGGESKDRPLNGLSVVEICHSVAGPFAGSILAQLGAEVIKVENPRSGDHARGWGPPYWHGTASAFQSINRDKSGITVDLGDPVEAGRLKQFILDRADIVIQNVKPGSMEKSILSGSRLRQEKPSLIYCNIGAFGARGPLSRRPGYDPLMQAFGGVMSVTGEADGNPVRVGPAVIDIGSGMWAVVGILAAIHRRSVTGDGCIVDTSLYETALAWMTIQIAGYLSSGEVRSPMGSAIPEIVPHQAFRTSDGFIMIAAGNDGLFSTLCKVLNCPELAKDPRFANNDGRVRNRGVLVPMIEEIVLRGTKAEWAELLDAGGVPNAPIQTIDQVVTHPQTIELGLLQQAPGLDMRLVGLPLSFDGLRPPFLRVAPTLGEHNRNLLDSGSNQDAVAGIQVKTT